MSILQPVDNIASQLTKDLPIDRICEVCQKKMPASLQAFNLIHVLSVGVPGHAAIPPFQCPAIEHWVCSPNCWQVAAHACIDEHMIPILENIFRKING